MPAKKTRQSDKAVYLLSANHKVRRVSLKKISERVKKARRPKRMRVVAKTTATEPPVAAHQDVVPAKVAAVALAAASLLLVATFVGASWLSSTTADAPVAAEKTETPVVLTADVASAPVIAAPAPTQRATNAPARPNVSPAGATIKPAAVARPMETVKPSVDVTPAPLLHAQSLASAEPQPVVTEPAADTVTITGCLDFDGKSAWLKNTAGVDAPKTRSWRSGFLKKSTPRIALVDGPLSAQNYDGRMVSVTGVLVDREMQVSSLKPIADNCD